jgi:hypothetical protein
MTTQSTQMLAVDRGTHLHPVPTHLDRVNVLNTHQHNRQHELAAWVADRADAPELSVALLGNCTFNGEVFNSGLIMFERKEDGFRHWQRVGVCIWLHSHVSGSDDHSLASLLSGKGEVWQHKKLIFG